MCLAVPMRVVELLPSGQARVESGAVALDVSLELVDDVSVGDYVIVHAGFALDVLDVAAARQTLDLLKQMAGRESTPRDRPGAIGP